MQVNDSSTIGSAKPQVIGEQVINGSNERYIFRLFIAGLTPRSTLAVERIRAICDRYLAGRYELTVIDLYLQPEEAQRAQIIVVPTLVKQFPSPRRLFIGDMADEKRILQGLNIAS
jgi:circadian clock protein KaiB